MEGKALLMEELEYLVMDELYFVMSYDELLDNLEISEEDLNGVLEHLVSREWVWVYQDRGENQCEEYDLKKNAGSYCYLASKKGLLAHNRL